MVGLSTSYLGLSAKIYTEIVDIIASSPGERAKLFLLLNSTVPLLVCVGASPLARDVSVGKSKKMTRGFSAMFVITVVTGVFAVVTSLTRFLPKCVIGVGMFVMLLLPLVVPMGEKMSEKLQQRCLIRVHDDDHEAGFASMESRSGTGDDEKRKDLGFVEIQEIGAKLMVRRVEFWLYFFVYFFGATLGLVYLNNLAQIAESRGSSGTSSLLSLSSSFSFFGRLLPSLLDYFVPRYVHKLFMIRLDRYTKIYIARAN